MVAEEIIHKVVDEIAFGLISPKDARADRYSAEQILEIGIQVVIEPGLNLSRLVHLAQERTYCGLFIQIPPLTSPSFNNILGPTDLTFRRYQLQLL